MTIIENFKRVWNMPPSFKEIECSTNPHEFIIQNDGDGDFVEANLHFDGKIRRIRVYRSNQIEFEQPIKTETGGLIFGF